MSVTTYGTLCTWVLLMGPSGPEPYTLHPGHLDISVEHISDCERLAKQCQLPDLLNDLEAKCKEVSEFGVSRLWGPGL